jgi:hypothetical protein
VLLVGSGEVDVSVRGCLRGSTVGANVPSPS